MPSIDERIVSMVFENRKFEAGVAATMKSLGKLDSTLQQIGVKNSLADIEKSANKVTLTQPMSALDKLKSRLFGTKDSADKGMGGIENAGNKVRLEQPIGALHRVASATAQVSRHATQRFGEIEAASGRVTLGHLTSSIGAVTAKFSLLKASAAVALGSIAAQAAANGAAFAKSFSFGPILQGLEEYKTNLGSIQTILANTQGQRVSGLTNVNKALSQLNTYSDKTIYNFSQMAKNIGTFTAAGVDLPKSVSAIKGIANLAALSGSNSEQASTAMYQLSQAIAAGRVGLQDWNSVVNAGMGGAVFQKALLRTADNMGALEKGALKIDKATGKATVNGKSFRESIMAKPGEKSWLTSDVLTQTLSQFTGDMTDSQLAAKGFNKEQIKAIQAQAKTAQAAATQVKTLSQVFDVAKETIGSGWSRTFQLIFGDFKESKKTFTELSNTINGVINKMSKARNKVLGEWKKLGGRTALIAGIKDAFKGLASILKPIHKAFRDIFPATTGKQLANLSKRFRDLMEHIKIGPKTADNLRRSFRGFFALLDIGKQIISGVFSVFGKLFGAVGGGSGSFLSLTASVGDFLVSVDKALKKGGKLHKFFDELGDIIATPVAVLTSFAAAIASAFSGDALGNASKALAPLQKVILGIENAWDKFLGKVGQTREIVRPALEGLSQMFGEIGHTIADAFKNADFDGVIKVIEVGLLGGIFLTLRKALSGGLGNALAGGVLKSVVQAFTGISGLTKTVGGTFNALTGSIKTMQQNVKSDTLKNIAISIALLSASIVALSFVDPKRLNSAMTAITLAFGELLGAMAIMDKIGKSGGFIKMPVIAATMVIFAVAIDVLALAVAGLSQLSWEELSKGLGAVGALLAALSAAAIPLSANSAGLIRAGAGITVIAVAMNILAHAVKTFGEMDTPVLAKGIGAIAVALAGIGAASQLFPTGMIAIGLGLIAVGAGLKIISKTIITLGALKPEVLGKGIGAIALALAAIGLAMQLMPGPAMVITAAGLVLVSLALTRIANVIKSFGGMSISEIGKGLVTLGASLGLLALGLYAMQGTLGGSAALLVASAGLALLAPALAIMGKQSWQQIIRGMVSLAAAFAILGVAGLVLAPVTPAILGLGVALIAIGAGLALAGAGVALIGIGLSAIAVAGPVAVKVLVDALVELADSLPKFIHGIINTIIQLVQSLADASPKFVKAVGKIVGAIADAVIEASPKIANAIIAILDLIIKVINERFPELIETGIQMLLSLLKGIRDNIGEVVDMVVQIINNFTDAIARNLSKIIRGGFNILLAIIKGVSDNIGRVITAGGRIVLKLLVGVANHFADLVSAGLHIIGHVITGIGQKTADLIKAGGTAIAHIITGIGNAAEKIAKAAFRTAAHFITSMAEEIPNKADQVASAIIRMLHRMADIIRNREQEVIIAMADVGEAIVEGIIRGMASLPKRIVEKIGDSIPLVGGGGSKFFKHILDQAKPKGKTSSAGTLFDGISTGIRDSGVDIEKSGNSVIRSVRNTLATIPTNLDTALNLDPVITPVLDLSAIQQGAKNIPDIATTVGVSTDASFRQATAILAEKIAADQTQAEAAAAEKPSVSFEQNNYSPEALSYLEIYRRTNNQVSRAKALLGT